MPRVRGTFHYVRSALLIGSTLGVMPGAASAQSAESGLETVLVTAQKREQNLQVVPVAVTALSSQTLQAIRFEDVRDLDAVAPGLTIRDSAGGSAEPTLTMRGVYGTGTYGSDPGVALYVNGVYVSGVVGADFDLANVERIEVLRGPQGTLFGRNAIGGAVNLITKDPSGKLEGHQELSFGNFGQFRSKSSIDFPAWGPLSAELNFLHDERDGDVRNLGAGTVWHYGPATGGRYGDRISPHTLGGHDTNAVDASLKLEPGADIKAVYRFDYSHKSFVPDAAGLLTFNTGLPLAALFQAAWNAQNPALRTPISSERPDAVNNAYTTTGLLTVKGHTLTLTAPIGDSVSIKNLTAYRKTHMDTSNQLDALGGLIATNGVPPGTPLLPLINSTLSDQRAFSNELQLNIDTRWVKSTVGYLHYYSRTVEGGFPNMTNAPFGSGLLLAPNFFLAPPYIGNVTPASGAQPSIVKTTSDAVFTQDELHLTNKLDLVLGGRWTNDRRSGVDNSPNPTAPGTPITYTKSTPSYLVGVNYQLADNIFTYAKFSTAYISGGKLANVTFDPSFARSWEAGVKSDLLDRRLRFNLALFTVKYSDIQILTNPLVGCAGKPGVSLTAAQCIVNGGDSRAKGVELEATFVPAAGLTLAGNMAYTDYYYARVDPVLRAADGTFVPYYDPKWTGTLSATYRGPEVFSGAHIIARADTNYTSSAFSVSNSTRALVNLGKIPSKWIVNARLGLAGFQLGAADVEVSGYAKNLTNDKSLTYGVNLGTDFAVNYQTARIYGVDLIVGF
jgi:iron complex outermembrane recepter protein